MNPERKGNKGPFEGYEALGLVGQIGIVIATPIVVGVFAGAFLDDQFGTRGLFVILGVLVGVAGGAVGAYRIISRFLDQK